MLGWDDAAAVVEPPTLRRRERVRVAFAQLAGAGVAVARRVEPHRLLAGIEREGRRRDGTASGTRTLSLHGDEGTGWPGARRANLRTCTT